MDSMTVIHVTGGGIALISGALAILLKKGSDAHKRAGYVFVGSMIVMAIPGGILSYMAAKPFDALSSLLSIYMVVTGWITFHEAPKLTSRALACLAGICIAGYLFVELYALYSGVRTTNAPTGVGFVFATILSLALLGDYRYLAGKYVRKQTLFRHLWRMNFGLLMATASFFGARPHLFPQFIQSSGLLILLTFVPIFVIVFWRIKLRTTTKTSNQ